MKILIEAGKLLLVGTIINLPFWLYFVGVI